MFLCTLTHTNTHFPESFLLSFSDGPFLVSTFFVGLVSAAAGGLLLGRTAVVLLASLELLVTNTSVMDNPENYVANPIDILEKPRELSSQRTSHSHVNNIFMSLFMGDFRVWTSCFSLAVGYYVGSSMYGLVIKRYSKTAVEKAPTLAGPVCLMGVTTTGYMLGFASEVFVSIDFTLTSIFDGFRVGFGLFYLNVLFKKSHLLMPKFLLPFTSSVVVFIVFMIFQTYVTLFLSLILALSISYYLSKLSDSKVAYLSLSLMLIVTGGFNLQSKPIAERSNSNGALIPWLFIWVLTLQLLMVHVGKLAYVLWQKGGAVKIGASSAALGGAVLMVIDSVRHVTGPGPTIGALTGVAGAAGVSLAAAEAVTQTFGGGERVALGKLGEIVGAAGGAFFFSFPHSRLLGVFMSLCAAAASALSMPVVDCLLVNKTLLKTIWHHICIGISFGLIIRLICLWFYLTYTTLGFVAICKFIQMHLFGIFGFS